MDSVIQKKKGQRLRKRKQRALMQTLKEMESRDSSSSDADVEYDDNMPSNLPGDAFMECSSDDDNETVTAAFQG